MKKRNSIVVIALLFVAVLTGFVVYNTYAKYTGSVTKNGTVTVAKWNFATDNTNANYNISIAPTADTSTLVSGKIAPGTSGSFNIVVTNTSEVGVNATVELGSVSAGENGVVPTGLKFYSDSTFTTEITPGNYTKSGKLAAKTGDTTPSLTTTIFWRWQYYVNADGDTADNTAGAAGSELTIPVTITGTQVEPSVDAITTAWN